MHTHHRKWCLAASPKGRPVAEFILICVDLDVGASGRGLGGTGMLSGGEMLRRKHRSVTWLQGPQCYNWLLAYTFIWPLPRWWVGSRTEFKKRREIKGVCLLTSSLLSLTYISKSHNPSLERDGLKGTCTSAVWYLLSCEKTCFKCQICLFLCCVISSPSLSFFPSFHRLHLCTLLPSLAFCLSHLLLSCAFLPVGIHVHVPDPNPGGLGRCHGPDSGGCRSFLGSGSSHLLHPLPSVRYPGEEHPGLFQM